MTILKRAGKTNTVFYEIKDNYTDEMDILYKMFDNKIEGYIHA